MSLYRLDSNGDLKVGDFGLAEDVYGYGYFRQGDLEGVKLPYKWMAVESLNDAIFNEKTDVVYYNKTCCCCCRLQFCALEVLILYAQFCLTLRPLSIVSSTTVVIWCDSVGGLQ